MRLGASVRVGWTWRMTLGCSKRGLTEYPLAAIDPHAVAAFAYGANAANLPVLEHQRATVWKGGWKIQPPPPVGEVAATPPAQDELARDFDLFRWKPSVLSGRRIFLGMGTRDSHVNLGFSLDILDPQGLPLSVNLDAGQLVIPKGHTVAAGAVMRWTAGARAPPSPRARWWAG